ncbi:MAG: triose-phosphate isomerase [Chloroflexi bacterium]|nr:triose-phosphate isomerase [Chloroflexota bacterium]
MVIPIESIGRQRGGRTPLIAGNWKMNTSLDAALELVEDLIEPLEATDGVECVLCPPFVWLALVYETVEGTPIRLGAQTMHWAEQGAYTGEIAPGMVAEFCSVVILGHSERRQFFGETDETVNKKVHAAIAHELLPIVCVGENLAQRDSGETLAFVGSQVQAALAGLTDDQVADIVIAYEPIWAIGTGRTATPEDANTVIGHIRQLIRESFGALAANGVRLLYGGSVTAQTAPGLMAMAEIDGALVGGASLKAPDFIAIVEAAASA